MSTEAAPPDPWRRALAAVPRPVPDPVGLTYARSARALSVEFGDGKAFVLPAELLRVYSPSAEVMGHGPGERIWPAGKAGVAVREIHPVGNYAVLLVFDDGHATGIYSWETLYALGLSASVLEAHYLAELAVRGLSR